MFKGLISFITSGALLNPVIFFGVLSGLIFSFAASLETIKEVYSNYHFYLLALFLSIVYNAVFHQVCKAGSSELDYKAMAGNVILYFIKFIAANALTISFVYMFKF